jgi:predicted MarR family transcription regulator
MPDEFDFKNYESMEDYGKTVEGTKYLHSLYLKAVNHPVRREILIIVNEATKISKNKLLDIVKAKDLVNDEASLDYNLDYLVKALCVKKTFEENEIYYEITQSGQVVDYL